MSIEDEAKAFVERAHKDCHVCFWDRNYKEFGWWKDWDGSKREDKPCYPSSHHTCRPIIDAGFDLAVAAIDAAVPGGCRGDRTIRMARTEVLAKLERLLKGESA